MKWADFWIILSLISLLVAAGFACTSSCMEELNGCTFSLKEIFSPR